MTLDMESKLPRLLRNPNYAKIARATVVNIRGAEYVAPLTRQAVSSILRGQCGYSRKSLQQIARVLGVSSGWLANYLASQQERKSK